MLAARATRRPGFFVAQGYGVTLGATLGALLGALVSDVTRRLAGAAAGVPSQPPAGALTWVAASGCGTATQVRTTARAAAAVAWSSLLPSSSRFLADSRSPSRAASANHL